MNLIDYRSSPSDQATIQGPGLWHVLTTEPQHESVAFCHLAARRFGVYLPELIAPEIIRARKREIHLPMFPGYLFVLVFGFQAHWRRIFACPGVTGVLMAGNHAAIVPDEAMRIIQAEETGMDLAIEYAPKPKKRWRRKPNPQANQQPNTVRVSMTTYDALRCLISLDDAQRNGALRKALGLGS